MDRFSGGRVSFDASINSTFWTRSRYTNLLTLLGVIDSNGELSNSQLPPVLGPDEIARIKDAFWQVPMDRPTGGAPGPDGGDGGGGSGGPGGGLRILGRDIFFNPSGRAGTNIGMTLSNTMGAAPQRPGPRAPTDEELAALSNMQPPTQEPGVTEASAARQRERGFWS